jgi:RimJ/RimL family protein N-acetyltransferase
MQIIRSSIRYAESYCRAVGSVARERKYLATTEGFPPDSTRAFVQHIEQNNLAQYFAVENNEVIGWCDILPGQYPEMKHVGTLGIGILQAHRGNGLGKTLLDTCIYHAKHYNNIEKTELEVFASNSGAIGFYRKAGFRVEGVRVKARLIDGIYDDIILMYLFI